MGVMNCLKRFSQIILIITNISVTLLGLAVMIIGIWANVNGRNYVQIADDASKFTEVSILIIVVGLFVLIVGIAGTVGAFLASFVFGRIILGLYAVILTLLVICEISGGIAAAVKKNDLQSAFSASANATFMRYSTDPSEKDSWNAFQESFHCCGVNGVHDYKLLNLTVPASCCSVEVKDVDKCDEARTNPDSDELYQVGCVERVVDSLKNNLGAVAGGVIVLGLFQIFGIVMACFVALYKKDQKYEVV